MTETMEEIAAAWDGAGNHLESWVFTYWNINVYVISAPETIIENTSDGVSYR